MLTGILNMDVYAGMDALHDAGYLADCVVTSPPYYRVRDYDAPGQIGQEPTVEEYVESLAQVGDRLHSILHPRGTWWLNIGDTYDSHSGLRCAPHMVALALKSRGWYLQLDTVWRKTRYMPNGGTSRPILIHEYVFMLTRRRSGYWYYPDATREPHSPISLKRWESSGVAKLGGKRSMGTKDAIDGHQVKRVVANPLGKLRASVWDICPSNYKGTHSAVMPEKLAEVCVLSSTLEYQSVLDPFAGAGTTGVVCKRLNRTFTGIEIHAGSVLEAANRIEATRC